MFQIQNPISCVHRLSYWPFFYAPTETNAHIIRTHNNNSNSKSLGIVFISHPKHCVLSIGSTGSDSKDRVPSVEFGEEKDIDDKGRENFDVYFVGKKKLHPSREVDDDVQVKELCYTSFMMTNKELTLWGEVKGDSDNDNDNFEQREVDASTMANKELTPWGEVVDDTDNDNNVEERGEVDASVMVNKELSLWGKVAGDSHNNDDVDERDEVDASFVVNEVLTLWGEVEDDTDNDNDDEERKEADAYFVPKKELPPWGDTEDDEHLELDFGPVVTTFSVSQETRLTNKQGAFLLEEMDENVLSSRILALSKTNKIRSAMEYFRSMELVGLCPNIHACNSLISSLLRIGRFDDCLKVFNFTRTRKTATGHTYSLILVALVKARGCNSALKFFRDLESECDVEKDFDAVVYNTVISICRNVDNWSEIERVWRSMKANGCAGTHVTYCLLVNSFVRCGQSELALFAYHEMVQNGFEPDSNTLNAIISVCAKEGKWGAALSVFQKMLTGRLKPNIVACNALINSLGRAGELKLAFQVYDTMKSLGHKPDPYTLNALLGSLNKANRHHEAFQLFEMIERNQPSQLNIHLYNTVLKSCSKLGLWDRALQILWQMEASGLSDLTVSYNLVIRTCELAKKPTIALEVYEHMVHQKCSPNIFTYLSIIRCCVRGDLWGKLEEILNTMPNATLYNATVQGMCLSGKINLANTVYSKMLEAGLQPDVKTQVLMHSVIRKRFLK